MNPPLAAADRTLFVRGALFGILMMIGADGIHWLITSSAHPDAGQMRNIAVVVQTLISFGFAGWLYYRSGRPRDEAAAT